MIRNINIPVLSLTLVACLQTAPVVNAGQPDWVNGDSTEYPNALYIVANASASDPETAKDRALSNLAKVFESHIRESSTTRQQVESRRSGGGEEEVDVTQSLDQVVNISTDKIIDGARVADQWKNSADLTHYALAVLDRRQAGTNIRSQINTIDSEASFEMEKAGKINDPLRKVSLYQSVLNAQAERSALQKMLKVIDLKGRGSAPAFNVAELRSKLEHSLNALDMRAVVLQDSIGGLEKKLKGAMAKAGFPASSGGKFKLSAGMETQPSFQAQGWNWLRGTLTLRLEAANGKVRGNKTWPLKVSAVQAAQLKQRMQSAVEKKLNAELKSAILGFATGE